VIFVVFNSRAEFDAFKAEFPRTLADPDTLLGEPAHEFPGDETTPPSGLCYVCHGFTADEAAVLQLAGADVRVGDLDGPEWPGEEPAP
jgi:hypothetical protein